MIKFFKDNDIKTLTLKAKYIMIVAKDTSSVTLKEFGKEYSQRGIYCRGGHILDTINGVITKIDKVVDFDFHPTVICRYNKFEVLDYNLFASFIEYRKYFKEYHNILLYWDQSKDKAIFEKTTHLDKIGSGLLSQMGNIIRQINVNEKIIEKIQLKPSLEETLKTFVDKEIIGKHYRD